MPKHTRLTKRGSVYWFRAKVPVDLLAHYAPAREITFSLKTKDLKEALTRVRQEGVRLDREFQMVKAGLVLPRNKTSESSQPLTDQQIDQLTAVFLSRIMEEDEDERSMGLDDRGYEKAQETADINTIGNSFALSRGNTAALDFEVEDLLKSFGFNLSKDDPTYRKLAYRMLKASVKADELIQARQRGEAVDTPPAPSVITKPVTVSITGLFEGWAKEIKPVPSTERAWRRIVEDFQTFQQGRDLTKALAVAWKDKLVGEELAPKTISNKLAALKAIVQWGKDNDHIPANPFADVRYSGKSLPKRPYTGAEVRKILEAARGWEKETLRWVPWLLAYTGARAAEICQLDVQDIRQERGVWVIDINEANGKSLKNLGSVRLVPLHPKLIDEGFLTFAQGKPKGASLFSDYASQRGRKVAAESAYKAVGEAVRGLGISGVQPNHGWRHTFKDACREAGIPEEIQDRLVGHTSSSVGRRYGAGHSLERLKDEISRVSYEGV